MRVCIANFKVYNARLSGIVNGLRSRLKELDPTSPLLKSVIPVMPDLREAWRVGLSSEEEESVPIAELVEGMTQHIRLQALIVRHANA